ncbi:MAG: hypothetical protein ACI8RD_004101 [Bacillariaceae sp.]|jgi:hypothetical protein
MPIPAVGEIFAAFSRHPLADHDPRYESFINGLNNNIAAYILSGTDKDRLLNDDATGFHDDVIDTLREAVISLSFLCTKRNLSLLLLYILIYTDDIINMTSSAD